MIEKKLPIRNESIYVQIIGESHLPTIVFLHGFTGTSATWSEVMAHLKGRFRLVAIDLTGHGKTSIPRDERRYTIDEQLKDLETIFQVLNLTDFTLVGYSMGGRIALAYTVNYPSRVKTLILESSSPGLKTQEERAIRKSADEKLARKIQTEGMQKFVDFWENIPLFDSQKRMTTEKQEMVREERLQQNEVGLANSLRGIGTGSQPSYWENLKGITIPVHLITGEIDQKFVDISQEMKAVLPNATAQTVKNVGHAIHVEKPVVFATMVVEHILSVNNLGRQ